MTCISSVNIGMVNGTSLFDRHKFSTATNGQRNFNHCVVLTSTYPFDSSRPSQISSRSTLGMIGARSEAWLLQICSRAENCQSDYSDTTPCLRPSTNCPLNDGNGTAAKEY